MRRFLTIVIFAFLPSITQAQSPRAADECHKLAGVGPSKTDLIRCSKAVTDAIKKAFEMSGGGTLNKEFGFAVVIDVDGSLVATRVTGGEAGIWRAAVPADAVAICHTHRNAVSPRPSNQDMGEADRLQILFFVISNSGLWIYEPSQSGKGRAYNVQWR